MPRDLFADNNAQQEPQKRQPRDLFQEPEPESFGQALKQAPVRITQDLYNKGLELANAAPEYFQKAKTEIPGFWKNAFLHPGSMAMQGLAGANEGINAINQTIPSLAKYGEERLNLLPKGSGNAAKRLAPEDTTEAINQLFSQPQHEGEAIFRGTARNLPNLIAGGEIAKALNPLNVTEKGIARNVIRQTQKQIVRHENMYNDLFNKANELGHGQVPVNNNLIDTNLDFIKQYKSPRDYRSVEEFQLHPNLENAQSATSDLKGVMRGLDEKSKSSSLTKEERHLYDAADQSVKHIEQNMFLNANGIKHEALAKRHKDINKSYRENVVPYRYNKAIQDYLDKKSTAAELVNSLSRGEFARKKGNKHPAIKIRNNLPKSLQTIGTLGGLGSVGYGINKLLNSNNQ